LFFAHVSPAPHVKINEVRLAATSCMGFWCDGADEGCGRRIAALPVHAGRRCGAPRLREWDAAVALNLAACGGQRTI